MSYCLEHGWSGYDPYDGLNSLVFQSLKFLQKKQFRLAFLQFHKRSPINFRRIFKVPRSQNPKALALFLTSCIKLAKLDLLSDDTLIPELIKKIIKSASVKNDSYGWGYNFDWQALTGFIPRGTPNVVCTSFVGHSLLDAYNYNPNPYLINIVESSANLIKNHFYYKKTNSEVFINYIPIDIKTKQVIPIHNANLLGASLLSRVARITNNADMMNQALEALKYSLSKQHDDGAWDYGEWDRPSQRWIDNFHTGFNLCSIRRIGQDVDTLVFEPYIIRGLHYYQKHFFKENGAPRYYHNKLYPIDIHSSAQSIITLLSLKDLDRGNSQLAESILTWTISHMYDRKGFFYYQKNRWSTNKISYMRWSQAWMLLALSTFLEEAICTN